MGHFLRINPLASASSFKQKTFSLLHSTVITAIVIITRSLIRIDFWKQKLNKEQDKWKKPTQH